MRKSDIVPCASKLWLNDDSIQFSVFLYRCLTKLIYRYMNSTVSIEKDYQSTHKNIANEYQCRNELNQYKRRVLDLNDTTISN